MYINYTRLDNSLACLSWYNLICHLPNPSFFSHLQKKAILWCIAHPLGKLIFKFWDSIRKIWLVSHEWIDTIFYSVYLEWSHEKNFIKTSFDHSKIVFVFLSVLIFLLPFSFYQLNGSLAKFTCNHNFLSLHLFAWKGPPPQHFLLGWNWAAVWHLGNWLSEVVSWFVRTEEMVIYKSKNTEERNNSFKNKTLFSCVNFCSACTLVFNRNLLFICNLIFLPFSVTVLFLCDFFLCSISGWTWSFCFA